MSTKKNIYGSLFVSNNISGDTLSLSTLNNNDSLTEVLARNSSGLIEYRDVQSIISAATSQDKYVTEGTYNEGTTSIDFSGNSVETTFSVSLSGISSNIEKRLEGHHKGLSKNSYTYFRRPVVLKWIQEFTSPELAIAFEKQLKGWRREKKEAVINGEWDKLPELAMCKNKTRHDL